MISKFISYCRLLMLSSKLWYLMSLMIIDLWFMLIIPNGLLSNQCHCHSISYALVSQIKYVHDSKGVFQKRLNESILRFKCIIFRMYLKKVLLSLISSALFQKIFKKIYVIPIVLFSRSNIVFNFK